MHGGGAGYTHTLQRQTGPEQPSRVLPALIGYLAQPGWVRNKLVQILLALPAERASAATKQHNTSSKRYKSRFYKTRHPHLKWLYSACRAKLSTA
jgi:hypothetical protein